MLLSHKKSASSPQLWFLSPLSTSLFLLFISIRCLALSPPRTLFSLFIWRPICFQRVRSDWVRTGGSASVSVSSLDTFRLKPFALRNNLLWTQAATGLLVSSSGNFNALMFLLCYFPPPQTLWGYAWDLFSLKLFCHLCRTLQNLQVVVAIISFSSLKNVQSQISCILELVSYANMGMSYNAALPKTHACSRTLICPFSQELTSLFVFFSVRRWPDMASQSSWTCVVLNGTASSLCWRSFRSLSHLVSTLRSSSSQTTSGRSNGPTLAARSLNLRWVTVLLNYSLGFAVDKVIDDSLVLSSFRLESWLLFYNRYYSLNLNILQYTLL